MTRARFLLSLETLLASHFPGWREQEQELSIQDIAIVLSEIHVFVREINHVLPDVVNGAGIPATDTTTLYLLQRKREDETVYEWAARCGKIANVKMPDQSDR